MNHGPFEQRLARQGQIIAMITTLHGVDCVLLDAESDLVEVISKYNQQQTRVLWVTLSRITQIINNTGHSRELTRPVE